MSEETMNPIAEAEEASQEQYNLEDWNSEANAEAFALGEGATNVDAIAMMYDHVVKGASMQSIGTYDNIGDSSTKDNVEQYLKSHPFARKVWMTVLHNSGTAAQYDKGLDTVKAFHNYHVNHNGWKAIGYHFVISTEGVIYAGRKMDYTGAHAGANGNPGSIGVCLVGNFETTDKPTEAQKKSFAALQLALNKVCYGGNGLKVRFHREFMSTGCPGKITQDEVMGWVESYQKPSGGTAGHPKVIVDGVDVGEGVLIDGRTYVKLRDFEKADYLVEWDQANYVATITSPAKQT